MTHPEAYRTSLQNRYATRDAYTSSVYAHILNRIPAENKGKRKNNRKFVSGIPNLPGDEPSSFLQSLHNLIGMSQQNGFMQIFKDFSNWSTVAAVPHIANACNKIARLFWILVFVVVLGVFGYQLYVIISKYLSYPTVVKTEILFDQQLFPVVVVCNINPYKYSVVQSNSAFTSMNELMSAYSSASVGVYSQDRWGLYEANNKTYDLNTRARDALILEAEQISSSDLSAALYTFSDLVQDCTFSSVDCSESDFTQYIDPTYGACYAFNENTSLNYTVSKDGIEFGLKLLLTVTQTTTDGLTDFLPTTKLAGARIAVVARQTWAEMDTVGIDVGVGLSSLMALSLTQNVRAKKPYGECVDREPDTTDYYQNYTYTLESCFMGCKQRDTVAKCGCAHPQNKFPSTDTPCQPQKEDIDCLQTLKGDQKNTEDPNINLLADCDCHPPCSETSFTSTVSLAKFPATSYYVATSSTTGPGSCSDDNTKFTSKSSCQDWYSKNGLIVQVFFDSISYELYTETASYTISNVINDLGGQAGLWLGLSVISVVEMLGLLLVMGGFCISGGKIKIRPNNDDIENDHRIKDVEDVKKELDHMQNDYEQNAEESTKKTQ